MVLLRKLNRAMRTGTAVHVFKTIVLVPAETKGSGTVVLLRKLNRAMRTGTVVYVFKTIVLVPAETKGSGTMVLLQKKPGGQVQWFFL